MAILNVGNGCVLQTLKNWFCEELQRCTSMSFGHVTCIWHMFLHLVSDWRDYKWLSHVFAFGQWLENTSGWCSGITLTGQRPVPCGQVFKLGDSNDLLNFLQVDFTARAQIISELCGFWLKWRAGCHLLRRRRRSCKDGTCEGKKLTGVRQLQSFTGWFLSGCYLVTTRQDATCWEGGVWIESLSNSLSSTGAILTGCDLAEVCIWMHVGVGEV